jgi:hypothetical protein
MFCVSRMTGNEHISRIVQRHKVLCLYIKKLPQNKLFHTHRLTFCVQGLNFGLS